MLRVVFDMDEITQNELDLLGDIFGAGDLADVLVEEAGTIILTLEVK